ncbi:MAG: hypothetical protein RLZZ490_1693 [Cyanobacteriota bacterium]|jgi:hypothetical protein
MRLHKIWEQRGKGTNRLRGGIAQWWWDPGKAIALNGVAMGVPVTALDFIVVGIMAN